MVGLKVRPRKSWGPIKNLLVSGYKIINKPKRMLTKMVFALVKLNKNKLKIPKNPKIHQLSSIDNLLLGIGLIFVLSTSPSKSLSHISFITQPIDLIRTLPKITINTC